MNIQQAKKLALNPGAFHEGDRFIVLDGLRGAPIESHFSRDKAEEAVKILSDHENRNLRDAYFRIAEVTE